MVLIHLFIYYYSRAGNTYHLQKLPEVSAVLETFYQSLSTNNTNVVVHETVFKQYRNCECRDFSVALVVMK